MRNIRVRYKYCSQQPDQIRRLFFSEVNYMDFFNNAITVLQTLVVAIGAGLAVWGGINLLEGYGNDNPGAKSQGIKHNMAK